MCMKMTQLQLGKLKENCSLLKLYRKLRKMFLSPRRESNPQPSVQCFYSNVMTSWARGLGIARLHTMHKARTMPREPTGLFWERFGTVLATLYRGSYFRSPLFWRIARLFVCFPQNSPIGTLSNSLLLGL